MKKLISIMLVGLGLTVSAQERPPRFDSLSFINGQNVFVSNNVSITGTSNQVMFVPSSGGVGTLLTNVQANSANSINTNIQNGSWSVDIGTGALLCDFNGNLPTSYNITASLNYTNISFPTGVQGGPTLTNTFLYGTNGYVAVFIPNASSTNLVTLLFQRSAVTSAQDPNNQFWGTDAQDQFSWAIPQSANAGLPRVMSTNFTSAFLQGTKRIRLLSITTGNTSSSTGVIVNGVWFNLYHP